MAWRYVYTAYGRSLSQIPRCNTLDHLTFRALYFSRIAEELSFRAFYIWCIFIQTPGFVIIWLHFDLCDCLFLAKSLIIKCSEILSDLGYLK